MNNTTAPPTRTRAEIDLLRRGYAECLLSSDRHMRPEEAATHAAARYPYPKVRRPRVVQAFGSSYKIENGRMYYLSDRTGGWRPTRYSIGESRTFYTTLLDLIDNPTEEVDA